MACYQGLGRKVERVLVAKLNRRLRLAAEAFALSCCLVGSSGSTAWGQSTTLEGPAYVAAFHSDKVAHVEVKGVLHNGSTEVMGGSGVRVTDSHVLTSAHLLSNRNSFKTWSISLRFRSRDNTPLSATLELDDTALDVALLSLPEVNGEAIKGCPMYLVNNEKALPMGAPLFFFGFPVDGPLRISGGLMSTEPSGELWETDAALNPGNSGGPAFTQFGYLAGIMKKSAISFTMGAETIRVEGISKFVPGTKISASEIGRRILASNVAGKCLRSVPMNENGSFGLYSPITQLEVQPPSDLVVAYTAEQRWKGASNVSVRKSFQASSGYRIRRCEMEVVAAAGASVECSVSDDQARATAIMKPLRPKDRFVVSRVVLHQSRISQ